MTRAIVSSPTASECEARIASLKEKQSALRAEHLRCGMRMKEIDDELAAICDWRGVGALPNAERELENAKRTAADAVAPRVTVRGRRGEDSEVILVSVGPKRVQTRLVGHTYLTNWTQDPGGRWTSYDGTLINFDHEAARVALRGAK